jgi:hypothetical protein
LHVVQVCSEEHEHEILIAVLIEPPYPMHELEKAGHLFSLDARHQAQSVDSRGEERGHETVGVVLPGQDRLPVPQRFVAGEGQIEDGRAAPDRGEGELELGPSSDELGVFDLLRFIEPKQVLGSSEQHLYEKLLGAGA